MGGGTGTRVLDRRRESVAICDRIVSVAPEVYLSPAGRGRRVAPGEGVLRVTMECDPSPDLLRKSASPNGRGEPQLLNQINLISSRSKPPPRWT